MRECTGQIADLRVFMLCRDCGDCRVCGSISLKGWGQLAVFARWLQGFISKEHNSFEQLCINFTNDARLCTLRGCVCCIWAKGPAACAARCKVSLETNVHEETQRIAHVSAVASVLNPFLHPQL